MREEPVVQLPGRAIKLTVIKTLICSKINSMIVDLSSNQVMIVDLRSNQVACSAKDALIVVRMATWLAIAHSHRNSEVVVTAEVAVVVATKSATNAIKLDTFHATVLKQVVVVRMLEAVSRIEAVRRLEAVRTIGAKATSASVLRGEPCAGMQMVGSTSKAGTTTTRQAITTGPTNNSRTTTHQSTKVVAGTKVVSTDRK